MFLLYEMRNTDAKTKTIQETNFVKCFVSSEMRTV